MLSMPRNPKSPQMQPLSRGTLSLCGLGAKEVAHLTEETVLEFFVNGRVNPLQRRSDRLKQGEVDNRCNMLSVWCKHTWQDDERSKDRKKAQSEPMSRGDVLSEAPFLQACTVVNLLVRHLPLAAQRRGIPL